MFWKENNFYVASEVLERISTVEDQKLENTRTITEKGAEYGSGDTSECRGVPLWTFDEGQRVTLKEKVTLCFSNPSTHYYRSLD